MHVSKGLFPSLLPIRFLSETKGAAALALTHVQVCGGNAGRLRSAVQHFLPLKDWTRGG